MQETILILGGAGYIGSQTAFLLNQEGYKIVIIDKLLHGQKFEHKWAELVIADFADKKVLNYVFSKYKIEAVMHFAALIEVGISVKKPAEFYDNNVVKTIKFLDFMLMKGVNKFIFSSTCAIYGNPIKVPIDEQHPFAPISPYGKNKLTIEYVLQDYSNAYGLNYVSLRYFNAAGAGPENDLGEKHNPETHIIPILLRAIKNNNIFKVFGTDYKTHDGSCIRDYIHVKDLATAHFLGLEYLNKTNKSNYFNLGTGHGYSVKDMIDVAQKICNKKANIEFHERRSGDVDILIADSKKANEVLGWNPQYSDIENILNSAWNWEQKINII